MQGERNGFSRRRNGIGKGRLGGARVHRRSRQ
jgi:hypothetical protein